MKRMRNGGMSLCLALGLIAGGFPAQASEVVKLARLVVSGKRGGTESARTTVAPAQPSGSGTHVHNGGGNDAAGTAPTPQRGVS